MFHGDMDFNQSVNARRLDGRRLYEIQIDNPGWPNPYTGGSVRPRSRRIVDYPLLAETYYPFQIGIERSLPKNLFVNLSYQRIRGMRSIRNRDINAPLPDTHIRPNPEEGQITIYEHNGLSVHHHIKASMRQRFSIFNVTANYEYYTGWNDQGTGAGFGGCAIALVPERETAELAKACERTFAGRGFEEPAFYEFVPSAGAELSR